MRDDTRSLQLLCRFPDFGVFSVVDRELTHHILELCTAVYRDEVSDIQKTHRWWCADDDLAVARCLRTASRARKVPP